MVHCGGDRPSCHFDGTELDVVAMRNLGPGDADSVCSADSAFPFDSSQIATLPVYLW